MYDLGHHTDLEPEGRRLIPESHTGHVYEQLPFAPEGLVFEYPPDLLREQVEADGWYKVLEAEAGSDGEITGTTYLHEPFYHTVGLLHFRDPDREVGAVCDAEATKSVAGVIVSSTEWRVTKQHGTLGDWIHTGVMNWFER